MEEDQGRSSVFLRRNDLGEWRTADEIRESASSAHPATTHVNTVRSTPSGPAVPITDVNVRSMSFLTMTVKITAVLKCNHLFYTSLHPPLVSGVCRDFQLLRSFATLIRRRQAAPTGPRRVRPRSYG